MKIKRVGSTFGFYTKKRIYVLQFTLKNSWILPRHEKHYGQNIDMNLYGWLFVYFGYFN